MAGVRGQRPLKLRAFCNFKSQGNTIFILKINVLKVHTGSVAISPPFFYRNREKKKKKIGMSRFLAVLKVVNRDDPDKIGTVGRYAISRLTKDYWVCPMSSLSDCDNIQSKLLPDGLQDVLRVHSQLLS